MKLKGLLTLKKLSTSKIMDVLNYSLKFKQGLSVSYSGKKMATLFFERVAIDRLYKILISNFDISSINSIFAFISLTPN